MLKGEYRLTEENEEASRVLHTFHGEKNCTFAKQEEGINLAAHPPAIMETWEIFITGLKKQPEENFPHNKNIF